MSRGVGFYNTLANILLVLGVIGVPLSLTASAAHLFLTNSDEVVTALGPLAEDPEFQQTVTEAIATPIHDQITTQLGFQLPGSEALVTRAVAGIVESDAFEPLWDQSLEAIHLQLGQTLTDQPGALFSLGENGVVELQLQPAVAGVKDQLVSEGVELAGLIPTVEGSLPLFTSPELLSLQGKMSALRVLAVVLPVVTGVLLVAGLVLPGDRRRRFMGTSVGVVGASLLLWVAVLVGRGVFANRLAGEVGTIAAEGAYERATDGLVTSIWITVVIAIVVFLVTWLAGSRRRSVR